MKVAAQMLGSHGATRALSARLSAGFVGTSTSAQCHEEMTFGKGFALHRLCPSSLSDKTHMGEVLTAARRKPVPGSP